MPCAYSRSSLLERFSFAPREYGRRLVIPCCSVTGLASSLRRRRSSAVLCPFLPLVLLSWYCSGYGLLCLLASSLAMRSLGHHRSLRWRRSPTSFSVLVLSPLHLAPVVFLLSLVLTLVILFLLCALLGITASRFGIEYHSLASQPLFSVLVCPPRFLARF